MSDDSSKPELTRWNPLAAIFIIIGIFLVVPLVVQLQLDLYPRLLGWSGVETKHWLNTSPVANFLATLMIEALTILVLFWFIKAMRANINKIIGLRRLIRKDIGFALLGFGGYFVVLTAMTIILSVLHIQDNNQQALGFDKFISGGGLVLAFISLVVLPPIAEEILFRGFFFTTLRGRVNFWWTAVLVSVVFGAFHLNGGTGSALLWLAFADTFLLSVILCYAREKTGSIWSSIFIHALKNGLAFISLFIIHAS